METKTRKRRKAFVEAESCVACGCCVKVCPREAIACRNWKHMTMQYLELSEYWEKLFQFRPVVFAGCIKFNSIKFYKIRNILGSI